MRRILLTLCLSVACLTGLAQGLSIGPGVNYGFGIKSPAAHLRSYFFLNEHLCFGPEFNWFLPRTETTALYVTRHEAWELNFNAHYVFEFSHRFGAYPITGIQLARERELVEDIGFPIEPSGSHIEHALGWNIGAGAHYFAGRVIPFVEYLYTVGDLGQHAIIVGTFIVLFEKKKDHSNSEHE